MMTSKPLADEGTWALHRSITVTRPVDAMLSPHAGHKAGLLAFDLDTKQDHVRPFGS
jgi:hypothetical protein